MTKLTCFQAKGWPELTIRPALSKRKWMDQTMGGHAYRCLPLTIANSHGWDIINPSGFSVAWDGNQELDSTAIQPDDDQTVCIATSRFGSGIVTFDIPGIFRTSPDWNLWVGGSPNEFKDGASPLTGIIETDWLQYSFTMNWKLTRIGTVRFEAGEPFCHFFPVQRGLLETIEPRFELIETELGLEEKLRDLSEFRRKFLEDDNPSKDTWQKYYYTGNDPSAPSNHIIKNRLKDFAK